MKPEIKKALARVARYDPHYPVEKGVEFRSALADIREELERLNEDYAYKNEQLGAALLRAEKAEAEVEEVATKASHFQHDLFCEEQDRIRAEQRAEQAEAKLARWKPLIEAVEQADKDGLFEEYMKSHGENALPIINAALTLKEAAEKREEEKK